MSKQYSIDICVMPVCVHSKDCEAVSGELNKARISSLPYHAGLSDPERAVVQDRWVHERRCKVSQTL